MSTDPQWAAAARRRRGQNQRAGFGQALQGVGGQLLGYMMQNQMANKQFEQQQALRRQEQQDQFTLGDLAALVNGVVPGEMAGPPTPGMAGPAPMYGTGGGALGSLFPGGINVPPGREGVPVPPNFWHAARDPARYGHEMGMVGARASAAERLAGIRAQLNAGLEAQRQQGRLDLSGYTWGQRRDLAGQAEQGRTDRAAQTSETARAREERLARESALRGVTDTVEMSDPYQWGQRGAEPGFVGAAADSVMTGRWSAPGAVEEVRSSFLADMIGRPGGTVQLPGMKDPVKTQDLYEEAGEIKVRRRMARDPKLTPEQVRALFQAWKNQGEQMELPAWAQ